MTMNGFRYISFLLLLSFSVYLGHSLIPHHHHAEVVPSSINGDCPIQHEDNHKNHHDADDHPWHCHAFNNVDFYKYNARGIQPQVRMIQSMLIPASVTLLDLQPVIVSTGYTCFKIPDKSIECSGAISLRAPPVSV